MLHECGGSCGSCNVTRSTPEFVGQPWRLFSATGSNSVVDQTDTFTRGGLFLLFEGGQFIWPGISIGFRRPVTLEMGRSVTLETLSLVPLVLSISDFLSNEECDHVIREAEPEMRKSKVALMDKDKGKVLEYPPTPSLSSFQGSVTLCQSIA